MDQSTKEAQDALLGVICHDLRAPLAAVVMGANFVLQTTPEDPASARSRRVLEAMLRSCKQMERLIRDFGDLAEIEAGGVKLRPALTDSYQLLEIAAEAARPAAAARRVVIEVAAGKPVLLQVDRDRVLRALSHVIDNAVRFAPEGTAVSLSATDEGGLLRFRIVDHGPGMSEETLANLYDRAWHAARAGRAGAGLGVAIARGFAIAHGGRFEVDAKPGSPTTFSFVVPIVSLAPARAVTQARTTTA